MEDRPRHLLQPSKAVHPNFKSSTLTTKEGAVLSGLVEDEDSTLKVTVPQGGSVEILNLEKTDVEERIENSRSIMPGNLLNTLRKDEIVDLLAFVLFQREEMTE